VCPTWGIRIPVFHLKPELACIPYSLFGQVGSETV
jgi:hypothetical protein